MTRSSDRDETIRLNVLHKLARGEIDRDKAFQLLYKLGDPCPDETTKEARNNRRRRFYAYIRVSTDQQAREGLSIPQQEKQARDWFEYLLTKGEDLEWGGLYCDDGESAFKINLRSRPAGAQLNAAAAWTGASATPSTACRRGNRGRREASGCGSSITTLT
jgi:hypothetical protein